MWSRSTDGGVTFPISGTIVAVPNNQSVDFNSSSPASFRWSDTPNITADPVDGTLYAVWVQFRTANVSTSAAVFLSKSTNDGTSWSTPVIVDNANPTKFQYMPWVQVSEDHVVHVTYGAARPGGASNSDVAQFYAQSTDQGATWSSPFQLSNNFTANASFMGDYQASSVGAFNYNASPQVSGNGSILATWTDTTGGNRNQWGRIGTFNVNDPIPLTCDTYTYITSTGASLIQGVTDIGNHCDDCTTNVHMPFSFQFYGLTFNNVNVSSNGNLQFQSNSTSFTNSCLPTGTLDYAIMPHWDDLETTVGLAGCAGYVGGCGILITTTGAAPNRVFTIEWQAVYHSTPSAAVNFEVNLFENRPSEFEFLYAIVALNGGSATVGVQQDTGSLFTQFSCNTNSLSGGGFRIDWTMEPSDDYVMTFPLGPVVPATTDVGNHCDDCNTNIILPFPYKLYDTSFTQVNVASNGNVQFNSDNSGFSNACLPTASMSYAILPYWDDLDDRVGLGGCAGFPGGNCGIFVSTQGTTPNRIFNIEWRTTYHLTTTLALNFELRLFENRNRFEVIYGSVPDDGNSATVGVQRDSAHFTQLECNTGLTRSKIVFTQSPDISLNGSISSGDPDATDRLFRDGTASICGVGDACPGVIGDGLTRNYEQRIFVNTSSTSECITIDLSAGYCTSTGSVGEIYSAAYLGSFNPANLCTNFLADSGNSSSSPDVRGYSFTVAPGAVFVVVVSMLENGDTCTNGYSLSISSSACSTVPTATPTRTATRTPTNTATPTPICPGDWTAQAVYPISIQDNAVVATNNVIYSFGGYNGVTFGITTSYSYNPIANSWNAIANLPLGRSKAAAAWDGADSIYIFGGWDGVGSTQTLYRYNINTDTYTTRASAIIDASAAALIYFNGKLYRFGGCQTLSCSGYLSSLEIYDIATNTWSPGASMPIGLSWLNGVSIGNFIYAGWCGSESGLADVLVALVRVGRTEEACWAGAAGREELHAHHIAADAYSGV